MEPRTQRCEACGAAFGCGAEVGRCWCDHVDLDGAALARLRASYQRCLCPDCLRAAAGMPLVRMVGRPRN
jgi:hypothetical protein